MAQKKNLFAKFITVTIVLLLGIMFVAKVSGPSLLRFYIETGIGNCEKIPILCMNPSQEAIIPEINKGYLWGLTAYQSPKISMAVPKGLTVVQEKIKKVYYKKGKRQHAGSVIYLLYKEPGFFINLFPQLTKQGVNDNFEFIKRTMFADLKNIKNLTDAFFIIMKGIFIPDLGNLKDVKMLQFKMADKLGFINYNLGHPDNYFDCNIIDPAGNFYKVYIKDRGADLNLDKVLTIISTLTENR